MALYFLITFVMAINVDTIYQRLLVILNKEQRGYVTPQDFNLIANQVQTEIFNGYVERLGKSLLAQNSSEYSDEQKIIRDKISQFEVPSHTMVRNDSFFTKPSDLSVIGTVYVTSTFAEAQRVTKKELLGIMSGTFFKASDRFPVYVNSTSGINVYGANEIQSGVSMSYLNQPHPTHLSLIHI